MGQLADAVGGDRPSLAGVDLQIAKSTLDCQADVFLRSRSYGQSE